MSSENTWWVTFQVRISGMFLWKFPECFMKVSTFSMRLVMHNLFSLQITFKKLSYHCLALLWWAQLCLAGGVQCVYNIMLSFISKNYLFRQRHLGTIKNCILMNRYQCKWLISQQLLGILHGELRHRRRIQPLLG